jgi:hypothetical protein
MDLVKFFEIAGRLKFQAMLYRKSGTGRKMEGFLKKEALSNVRDARLRKFLQELMRSPKNE